MPSLDLIQMIQASGRMQAMSLAIALNQVVQRSETARTAVIDALAGPAPPGGEALLLALTFHGAADPESTRVVFRLAQRGRGSHLDRGRSRIGPDTGASQRGHHRAAG
jgi:hypothetical protein